ncbi:hypothetical protein [Paenibacillus agilis]|nr:hypothetical protein [Paenibacillus agilis]
MIETFIHDMIHMTEGQKLIYYWPLWLVIVLIVVAVLVHLDTWGD